MDNRARSRTSDCSLRVIPLESLAERIAPECRLADLALGVLHGEGELFIEGQWKRTDAMMDGRVKGGNEVFLSSP